ncbi:MAG TPA: tetratricopeptide repeat protein [Gemmatimonadota bacterium]|nr:tetratricopeptide repeat protein [Gemmatimonadota bacterium]
MKSYQQLFAELKRRHVFKVAAIYGATAFVVLQLADLLGQGLQLPAEFLSMITVLVLLGFPFALIVAWAFEVTPAGVRRTDPASREELAAIVAQPASRRWPAGLLALAGIAALVAGAWWAGRRSAPPAEPRAAAGADSLQLAYGDMADDARPSIAVLPFADMSREGDQEYFSDGMTEELLNTLANIRDLRVSGRTSTFAFKERDEDLRTIGNELGVQYLVEGSVRKDGDQLRITAQLIDAKDGSHLWSETYDRTLESVFAIQTEIATAIANQLRVPLGLDDPSDLVQPTGDFGAYDLYLSARARMRERGASMSEAVRLYRAAIAADSGWAPAWAGLAEALEIRVWYREAFGGETPDSTAVAAELEAAETAARHALQLDPRSSSAHVALGNVLRDRFDWEPAERAYRQALALDPDNAEAYHQYGELLILSGRVAEGVRAADRAAALDPAPVRFNVLGAGLRCDDRYDEAERAYLRGIRLDPDESLSGIRRNYFWLLYTEQRYEEALERMLSLRDDATDVERVRTEARQFFDWLRQGTLSAIPDTARNDLLAEDWIRLGYPDSAAVRLVSPTTRGLAITRLYQLCDPTFDEVRQLPIVQEYLRNRDLDGVIHRTPVDQRETPVVLRKSSGEETS